MNETISYVIDRHFAAPRDLVWEMFTTPEHFAYWWGGTDVTVPVESVIMDVRADGTWKATMIGPDEGWSMNWAGEYLEVDPPNRLVMTLTDQVGSPERDFFAIDFTDEGDGTHVTLAQGGGNLPADMIERTKEGTSMFLDALAMRLGEVQAQ
jgi:uncharacterized protein YndB with AHSA1/START domain